MKAGRSRPEVVIDLGLLGGAGGALRYVRDDGERLRLRALSIASFACAAQLKRSKMISPSF